MKLGVVSDIHGNLPALQAVVADGRALGVQRWLNLGDIVSGPLWPAETADWLMARGWPTIAGNHERQVLTRPRDKLSATDRHTADRLQPRHRDWLAALPAAMDAAPGLHCVHGTPASDLEYLLETVLPEGLREARDDEVAARLQALPAAAAGAAPTLVLCGHTHLPRDRRLPGGLRVVNPGSVGLPAYDDDYPYPHVVENGTPHARYAVVEDAGSGWRVELRAVAYDWEAAARQAEAHGRGDWADALRSGRVGRYEREVVLS
ncbi:MAG: metallophosphoesterase family protein [Rubrivivax sp.]|nr:metallophosphoesterase family protein [Rubrivivax sp.]